MSRHTPGPWTRPTDGERFRHDNSAGIKGPNGMYVAAALDFNRTDRDDEVEANARLIATAPDLLDVAIMARHYVAMAPENEWRNVYADLATIERAIAKALGET